MKNHITLLFSVLIVFTQCTIQKRLYNPGYHIEFKRKIKTEESIQQHYLLNNLDEVSLECVNDNPVLTKKSPVNPKRILDSTVYIAPNKLVNDTVYMDTLTKSEASRKKKQRLIGVGIPMIGLGAISAGALSSAATAGTNLSAVLFLSAVGWICAAAAAILLIVFIVFLCTRVKDKPHKSAPEKSKLSKGERTGLALSLILVGLIGMAFWISSL